MEECICGKKTAYYCLPCKATFCKEHKTIHVQGKQRVLHVFEKIGKKLNSEKVTKIIFDLSSKIQIANKCEIVINDQFIRIMAEIQDMHIQTINIIKEKQKYYTNLLINCKKKLHDNQIKEIEQELFKSIVIKPPSYKFKEFLILCDRNFLQETKKIDQSLLEESYGLFLESRTGPVCSIAITNSNSHIISSSYCDTIRIWNLHNRTQEPPFRTYGISVYCLTITSDSKYIIAGCFDKTVRILNFQDRICETILKGHTDSVRCVSVSRNSKYIASASKDKTLIIWSLQSREQIAVLRGHTLEVLAVRIATDSKYIISGSKDRTIRVWNLQQQKAEAILKGHDLSVTSIAITSDNQYIASASEDNTFRVWSLIDRKNIAVLQGTNSFHCGYVAITSDDQSIVCGSFDTVRIWNFREEIASERDRGWANSIMKMFSLEDRRGRVTLTSDHLNVNAISITSDNEYLVTGSCDYPTKIWSLKDLKEVGTLEGHNYPVVRVGITSDENYAISADTQKIVRIWSIPYKRHEAVFTDLDSASEWILRYPEIRRFFN